MNDGFAFYVQRYFSAYLIAQRHYGENTIASYRDTFRLLLIYLDEKPHKKSGFKMAEIGYECCTSFLQWLEDSRGSAASTRNVRLAHLKSFYGYVYLHSPEYAAHCSKVLSVPFAKAEKKPPGYLTTDAITHLLHCVDAKEKEGLRHLAILSLLYDSGCRVQELIGLRVSDIQCGKCCRIFVHGKGDKYREIPILPETADILQKYVRTYALQKTSILFANVKGESLTRQGIRHIIRKYVTIAQEEHPDEFETGGFPHLLRHSKATHLVNSGVNLYNIRDFLGHESVVTTQIYLTSNPEVTRKAIEAAASKTVPQSADFYSAKEKEDLMAFLETLC
jgi:integrase/recombinase XerD